jgi:tRNA threonylcarbamoyladenosine biosynthesis protein TsaB
VIVLGFDTATSATAVGLRLVDGSTTQARDDPPAGEHPGHATRLLEMSHELLADAGVAWGELGRIAVGVGPGTFTGLRVGIATARGLAQSLSVELVGVSSLSALAASAFALESAREPHVDSILAVIDARRGEVFAAAYEQPDPGVGVSGALVELSAPVALAPGDLESLIARLEQGEAGGTRRWLAVGDGAVRYRDRLELAGLPTAGAGSPLHLLSAEAICALGANQQPVPVGERLAPHYLRRPDAELALEAAGAGRSPQRT